MSTALIQQSVLYCAPASSPTDWVSLQLNTSGLGTSQNAALQTTGVVAISTSIATVIQTAAPAPLLYYQLLVGDTVTIFTPSGEVVTPQSGTIANTYFFQPAPEVAYNVVIFNGTAKIAGVNLIIFQSVIQNTIGQIIDMSSIVYPNKSGVITNSGEMIKPVESTSVMSRVGLDLNTTSAIPNTMFIDINNMPVRAGKNFLVTISARLNSNAVVRFAPYGSTGIGTDSSPAVLVATQGYSFEYDSTSDGFVTGTFAMTILAVGQTVLPPTVAIECLAISANIGIYSHALQRPQVQGSVSRNILARGNGKYKDDHEGLEKVRTMVEERFSTLSNMMRDLTVMVKGAYECQDEE